MTFLSDLGPHRQPSFTGDGVQLVHEGHFWLAGRMELVIFFFKFNLIVFEIGCYVDQAGLEHTAPSASASRGLVLKPLCLALFIFETGFPVATKSKLAFNF